LARFNSLSFSDDIGRLLENFVYLNLKKRYKSLFYFREQKECDFVVFEKNSCKWIIQVTNVLHKDNRDREINGLMTALDFFELDIGYILTMNQKDEFFINNKKIVVTEVKTFFESID
jgi:uncharacterized protein